MDNLFFGLGRFLDIRGLERGNKARMVRFVDFGGRLTLCRYRNHQLRDKRKTQLALMLSTNPAANNAFQVAFILVQECIDACNLPCPPVVSVQSMSSEVPRHGKAMAPSSKCIKVRPITNGDPVWSFSPAVHDA